LLQKISKISLADSTFSDLLILNNSSVSTLEPFTVNTVFPDSNCFEPQVQGDCHHIVILLPLIYCFRLCTTEPLFHYYLVNLTAFGTIVIMNQSDLLVNELRTLAKTDRAKSNARYFKANPGQYGEGDCFLGVTVPEIRVIARKYFGIELLDLENLYSSPYHEVRLCAAIITTFQFKKAANKADREKLFSFYLKQLKEGRVNNWDIVDVSAPTLGIFLLESKNAMKTLENLAHSKSLWERRVGIMFTFAYIRYGDLLPTYKIAHILINDSSDLIHKATGWMLREMGKRDITLLRTFLTENSHLMPRTMLRYAIEKLPLNERKRWLTVSKDNFVK
jgi:3-methyladenine DNA glycosylase AlkD